MQYTSFMFSLQKKLMRSWSGWWLIPLILLLIDWYVFTAVRFVLQSNGDKARTVIYTLYWLISVLSVGFVFALPYLMSMQVNPYLRNYIFAIIVGLFFAKLVTAVFLSVDDARRGILFLMSKIFPRTGADFVPDTNTITRSAFLSWAGIAAGGGMDRTSRAGQNGAGFQHALYRLVATLDEILGLQAGQPRIDRRHRHVLARIDFQRPHKFSLGEAEGQRLEVQHTALQADMGVQTGERKVSRSDGKGAVIHFGIGLAQPFCMQHGFGQQIPGGDRRVLAGSNHRAQVLEAQHPRSHLAAQRGNVARRVHRQVAGDVGGTQHALDVIEAIELPFPHHSQAETVGRRAGQHQAGQEIQIRQGGAADIDAGVETIEMERLGDGAVEDGMGFPRPDVGGEGIGLSGIDIQQRAALHIGEELVLVKRAVAGQAEGGAAAGVRLFRRDGAGEPQLAHGVFDHHMALAHQEALDRGKVPGTVRIDAAAIPVGAARGIAHHQNLWLVEFHQRENQVAENQRQQAQFDPRVVDLGGLLLADPGGVADIEPAHIDDGLQREQLDRQIAVDPDLPPGALRQVAADRPPHLVPVQEIEGDNDRDQEGQQGDAAPFEETVPGETEAPEIVGDAPARALKGRFQAGYMGMLCNGHDKSIT